MNESVKAYLEQKKAENREKEAARRTEILIKEGLCRRVYPETEEYNYEDFPKWDDAANKNYREVPLEVSDEEFREIEKYATSVKTLSNVGKRIMGLATTICCIGVIVSILSGIALMAEGDELVFLGILVAGVGSLSAWISSWFMYAYGQLVDDTHTIRNKIEEE